MVTKVVPAVRKSAAMHDVGSVDRTEASMRAD
jgi:hypothetical protein